MYIKIKDLPKVLQEKLSSINYSRADIEVIVKPSFTMSFSDTSGCRAFAMIVNLGTGESNKLTGSWGGANMFNPNNIVDTDDSSHPIPSNGAIIKGTEGDVTCATIYVSSSSVVKALSELRVELTANERGLLKCFLAIRSGCRKEYIFGGRYRQYFDNPLNEMQYAELIKELALKGLVKVNKANAVSVTIDGKNA